MEEKVEQAVQGAMTVRTLIEMLEDCDADAPVFFVCDYGDYHHTQQALHIGAVDTTDTSNLEDSAYSHSGIALCDRDDGQEFWCPKCEKELDCKSCPQCGTRCVDESGELARGDDDTTDVVIINTGS